MEAEVPPAPSPRRRLTKTARVGLGLLFTLVGLFLSLYLLPSGASQLVSVLPLAAAALLAIWLGGLWLGRAAAP